MMENLKDRFSKWKISNINPTGEHMIAFRKYGHKVSPLCKVWWGKKLQYRPSTLKEDIFEFGAK